MIELTGIQRTLELATAIVAEDALVSGRRQSHRRYGASARPGGMVATFESSTRKEPR